MDFRELDAQRNSGTANGYSAPALSRSIQQGMPSGREFGIAAAVAGPGSTEHLQKPRPRADQEIGVAAAVGARDAAGMRLNCSLTNHPCPRADVDSYDLRSTNRWV